MRTFTLSAVVLSIVSAVVALSPAEWRNQSVYQVLTDRFARSDNSTTASCALHNYCGGSWQGLISHLDYIQNMGFTAVWISPVVGNIQSSSSDGDSYHGYWAQKINSVNSNFGSPDDLKALSSALHSRGMYLMVDVVTNHMGYDGCGTCVDYSTYDVFNNQDYFHPFCLISNYTSPTNVETCWEGDNTVSLPDLKTEDNDVRGIWNNWITSLVANYSIDGLRIDSCLEVEPAFFPGFLSVAGVYAVCEIFSGDPAVVCPYQSSVPGALNYPAYYWITQAFQSTTGNIGNLVNGIATMKSSCADTTLLGSFIENHDNPRFPSYTNDISLAQNAIGFSMLADGIPIVYEGQEQHYSGGKPPNSREPIWTSEYNTSSPLYTYITALNKIRSLAISKDTGFVTSRQSAIYHDFSTIAVSKGSNGTQLVSVFSNLGASGTSYTLSLSGTGFAAGTKLTELLSCTDLTVSTNGTVPVPMGGGQPKILYQSSALAGSGICDGNSASQQSRCTTTPTGVAVTFNELAKTAPGESIKIVGNTTELGSWKPASAIALSANHYSNSNPLWAATINLPSGQAIAYKFVNVASNGTVTWESNPNRIFNVPATSGCEPSAIISDSWR